ncbi:MAG: NusG domain II-containing protein [Lawsonibacter sp.]|nr:NusG domain II-containing protein [Lawsonibacter sp.]
MRGAAKWVAIGLVLVVAAAAALLFQSRSAPSPVARITRDGAVVEEIPLDQVAAPYTITLEDSLGTNLVQVERGRIRIAEADCPDQVCVNQGWISDGTVPVICLPHRLVIEIRGGGELDGAAG